MKELCKISLVYEVSEEASKDGDKRCIEFIEIVQGLLSTVKPLETKETI